MIWGMTFMTIVFFGDELLANRDNQYKNKKLIGSLFHNAKKKDNIKNLPLQENFYPKKFGTSRFCNFV